MLCFNEKVEAEKIRKHIVCAIFAMMETYRDEKNPGKKKDMEKDIDSLLNIIYKYYRE